MGKKKYDTLKCPFCQLPVGSSYLSKHVLKYHLGDNHHE